MYQYSIGEVCLVDDRKREKSHFVEGQPISAQRPKDQNVTESPLQTLLLCGITLIFRYSDSKRCFQLLREVWEANATGFYCISKSIGSYLERCRGDVDS